MTTETTPAATHELPPDQSRTAPRGLVELTVALAASLTLNTLLGPLGLGVFDYDLDRTLDNQLLGLELVTVGLVVPALLLGAVLIARGRPPVRWSSSGRPATRPTCSCSTCSARSTPPTR